MHPSFSINNKTHPPIPAFSAPISSSSSSSDRSYTQGPLGHPALLKQPIVNFFSKPVGQALPSTLPPVKKKRKAPDTQPSNPQRDKRVLKNQQDGEPLPVLTDYVLIKYIQKGISSRVYESQNIKDGSSCAAKMFNIFDKAIKKEYNILTELLNVPHAIQCRALGQMRGLATIITEKTSYPDLSDYLDQNGAFSLARNRFIAQQGCEFLKSLKAKGIIHGDIKPDNMSFGLGDNRLVVFDYGISQKTNQTDFYSVVQSLNYRDPIVDLGHKQYDESIDMWSLACTLFLTYTNTPLFPITKEPYLHLQNVFSIIGMPSLNYLNKMKCTETFFTRSPFGFHLKTPLKFPSPTWQTVIRQQGASKKDHPLQVEQYIDLLSKMLRYEDRITPEQALAHPFFENITNFCIQLDEPSLRSYMLSIYKPGEKEKLSTIDLSAPKSSLCCQHILSSKQGYIFQLVKKGTNEIGGSPLIPINNGDVLSFTRNIDGGWSVIRKPFS